MTSRARIAAAAAVIAAAGAASAHGVSKWIGGLESAVTAEKAAVAADPVRLKQVKKIAAYLGAKANAKSFSAELTAVAKAAGVFETKLADQLLLSTAFANASIGYGRDISATRSALALASTSTSLSKTSRKAYAAQSKRFEAAFTAKRKPAPPLMDQLYRDAVAAKAAAGFTPYDAGTTYDWVISSVQIATGGVGVDLDGDGTPDNQLGAIQTTLGVTGLDQAINTAIASGGRYALLEMWYLKNVAKPDPMIFVGVMSATDGDADTSNDFTGTGIFAVDGGAVSLDDGHASTRMATSLAKKGKYSVGVAGKPFQLGGIFFPPASALVIKANATASTNLGLMGLGIPVDTVVAMAASGGVPLSDPQKLLLAQLADLDLDTNVPGNDALSVSFTFTAVKATVTRP